MNRHPHWPEWTTALPDWERRIVKGESLMPMPALFPEAAQHALNIFEQLKIVDATGSPTFGEAGKKWLFELVNTIFGAYDPETNERAIREVFLLISKKNSKSTVCAGIMLTALLMNARQGGEMGIVAPTLEVANNAWRPIRDAINADEDLKTLLHVMENTRQVRHRTTGATLQVVAAEANAVAGKKWIVTLIDELWLFGKREGADKMLVEATGGLASRPEGFVMYSSTHADDPPAGVFREKLAYARAVRDGEVVDPNFLPVLYEFPPAYIQQGKHKDPDNFHITNPNLGASVSDEFLRREFQKAQMAGDNALRIFMAKHLNVEVGLALRSDRWSGADFWQRAGNPRLGMLEDLLARSEVVVAGIDGGGLDDLLGLAVLGREKETRRWLHWAHAWAHPIVLERHKEIAPKLKDLQALGQLTLVSRPGEDVQHVCDTLSRVKQANLFPPKSCIGVDPYGIADIVKEIANPARNFNDNSVVAVSQGWRLNGAIKTVERMIAGGEFEHGATELMAWAVGNAKVVPVGNAISINKQISGSAKIDPLMATFNAASLMALNPQAMRKKYQVMFV